ncbi:DEAD/DEAH box helicase [Niallia sp. NCCP-28]|uniref:DEAD/DEAH box helicase n=1 Tax=Niallia sp. NCCP-28 TaxID=2934712 RepID=UPI00208849C0|nr:DEAD/DEAH box helicase [Niallia sp. NCCP-28]GKU82174.1 helicase SNF [Niallia sp. NCCP-28]
MNIKLTQKIIKELCGDISFKRGDSFYRNNKVLVEEYDEHHCLAIVKGAEDFYVTITKDKNGAMETECSCPKLASFDRDCQHIAAVLLEIMDYQRAGISPSKKRDKEGLSEGFMQLFTDSSNRKSGHLRHFENRQVMKTEFICRFMQTQKKESSFFIKIIINKITIQDIQAFLQHIKRGKAYSISPFFTFDQGQHCFSTKADKIMHELSLLKAGNQKEWLLIPPASWNKIVALLADAPNVILQYGKDTYNGLKVSSKLPPLQFDFMQTNNRHQLSIKGLENITILPNYQSVLVNGQLIELEYQDCQRLYELKEMMNQSGTNRIPIAKDQIDLFLEKVAPSLQKLGAVTIEGAARINRQASPLAAKLYLDRINNLLLAGLEFDYDHININPLEDKELEKGIFLVRDTEKEAEIIELMEESYFTKTDSGYMMQNEELEYEFLYHILPKLQKIVQVYATTAVRNRIFRETARPMIKVRVKKERTNWLEFKFDMKGISELEIKEILEALEEKRKYYRLRNGSLFSLETREMEEIQRFLHSPQVEAEDLLHGLEMPIHQGLSLVDQLEENSLLKAEHSFKQLVEHLTNPGSLHFNIPESLKPILKNYQTIGFYWMKTIAKYRIGGILADDMGLGKTVQAIAFILSELQQIRNSNEPVLIICPSSLTYNWLSELMKFAPEIQGIVMDGTIQERAELQNEIKNIDAIITSYPLLLKDIAWYEKQIFSTVILDEAQYFKNPTTQTAKAVKKIQAANRFALTGTPVENAIEELWSIFHVVFPPLFGGLKEYSNLPKKTIAKRIRPFMLRRLKEEVLLELPKKKEWQESMELLPEQKKIYAAYLAKLRHDTLKHLDKDTFRKNKIRILAGLTRLRQICCHPSLFIHDYKGKSAKLETLLQLVESANQAGRRVLIFSQFTKMLQIIGTELAILGFPFFYLDGQTTSEERVNLMNRFNAGERDFFLISLKAGGTGLNLMTADTVILYDAWWNPAVEEQAADRAHRMGQINDVHVIKLVARGTIEDKINELQEKKKNLVDEIIDSEEDSLPSLTEEEIKEILNI